MKYCLIFLLFLIIGLFFITQTNYAQTSISIAIEQQIPAIDPQFALEANKQTHYTDLCPPTRNLLIDRCFGEVIDDDTLSPFTTSKPSGFGPAEFRKAYGVIGEAKKTHIVAIIDAYDQPDMSSDLQTYSKIFNLPQLSTCSSTITKSSIACFKKVDQNGGVNYPTSDSGWALEISLDVEDVHAMYDNCSILLVEAKSASNADLLKAVDTRRNNHLKLIWWS